MSERTSTSVLKNTIDRFAIRMGIKDSPANEKAIEKEEQEIIKGLGGLGYRPDSDMLHKVTLAIADASAAYTENGLVNQKDIDSCERKDIIRAMALSISQSLGEKLEMPAAAKVSQMIFRNPEQAQCVYRDYLKSVIDRGKACTSRSATSEKLEAVAATPSSPEMSFQDRVRNSHYSNQERCR